MTDQPKAHDSQRLPERIDTVLEEIRLWFESDEHKGIRRWCEEVEEFLRNGQFKECKRLIALAHSLTRKVTAECKARFQFVEGQFRERRNRSGDLMEAGRLYLQSSKTFDELLDEVRAEVQSCRRHGNKGKSMVEVEAALNTRRLDSAFGHDQLGAFYFIHLKPRKAIQHYRAAARLWKAAGSSRYLALALVGLGEVHRILGDFRRARSYFEQAIRIEQECFGAASAAATYALGALSLQRSQFEEAERRFSECVRVAGAQNDLGRNAAALQQRAAIYQNQGKYRKAEADLDRAREVFEKLNDRVGRATVSHQQALLFEKEGEFKRAKQLYEVALEDLEDAGVKAGVSQTHHQLGMLCHELGEDGEALRHYSRSLRIARSLKDRAGMTWTLYQIGRLHQDQGSQNCSEPEKRDSHYAKAARMYRASMKAATRVFDERAQARALYQLGIMAQSVGKYNQAESCYQDSRAMYHAAQDLIGEMDALYRLGDVYRLHGKVTEARRTLKKSIALARRISDRESVAASLQLLSAIDSAAKKDRGADINLVKSPAGYRQQCQKIAT